MEEQTQKQKIFNTIIAFLFAISCIALIDLLTRL